TARVSLSELEQVPTSIGGVRGERAAFGQAEFPPQEAVVAEVRHLEAALPFLSAQEIPVYVVRERCFLPGFGWLAGCTLPGQKAVYLFASPRYRSYIYRVKNGVARPERYAPTWRRTPWLTSSATSFVTNWLAKRRCSNTYRCAA
ncbi:hypothetical protein, partial [Thermodesulfitimonas sp.]